MTQITPESELYVYLGKILGQIIVAVNPAAKKFCADTISDIY